MKTAAPTPKILTAKDVLFRCHMIGSIIPADAARVKFTQEAMDKMIDIFNFSLFKRREEIKSKYLEKGNEREEDCLTLISRVTKTVFNKNEDRLENAYISGVPDTFLGKEIRKADETIDAKTSWSKNTFDKARVKPLEKDYVWQGHGYMALTGAKQHRVFFGLVNGTAKLILDEKRKAQWALGILDPYTKPAGPHEVKLFERYKKKCQQIEINHIFDIKAFQEENPGFDFENDLKKWEYDIPMQHRIHEFVIKRDESAITRMYARVIECRQWMDESLFYKAITA
jgi:hypothetical protein